jgi:hypothetical protein
MSDVEVKEQSSVAKTVLWIGGGAIVLLFVCAGVAEIILAVAPFFKIDTADFTNTEKLLNNIINATLPLIGVWVGAVISYYFGKANFDAATRSVHDAYKAAGSQYEKLADTTISSCMMPYTEAMLVIRTTMSVKEAIAAVDLFNKANPDVYRLPVFDGDTHFPVAYFEKSDLDDVPAEQQTASIAELVKASDMAKTSFRLIAGTKTMKDASVAISEPGVCILYVTQNGQKREDLLGIVTAKDIAKCLGK